LTDAQIDEIIQWAISQMDIFKKYFPEYINKLEK